MNETRIDLDDGKYTVIHDNGVNFRALRYGEEWRSLTGDKLVLTMAQEIERLREIEADREVKASNLEKLVDMVLHYSAFAEQFADGPPYDDAGKTADGMWKDVVALARGLKQ